MQFEIVFTNICRLNTPSGHYNTKTPVPRIESGSHAWQAGILTTILSRKIYVFTELYHYILLLDLLLLSYKLHATTTHYYYTILLHATITRNYYIIVVLYFQFHFICINYLVYTRSVYTIDGYYVSVSSSGV